jgi:hypothetical protein
VKTAGIVRCFSNNIHESRGRAGKKHDVFCGDCARQSLSLLDQRTARLQARTLGGR